MYTTEDMKHLFASCFAYVSVYKIERKWHISVEKYFRRSYLLCGKIAERADWQNRPFELPNVFFSNTPKGTVSQSKTVCREAIFWEGPSDAALPPTWVDGVVNMGFYLLLLEGARRLCYLMLYCHRKLCVILWSISTYLCKFLFLGIAFSISFFLCSISQIESKETSIFKKTSSFG